MKAAPTFFSGTVRASLPLWLWALHFAFCYAGLALGCHAGWDRGEAPLRGLLLTGSALAVAAASLLLWRAWLQLRSDRAAGLLSQVRLAAAVMAWIGIVWTSVPLLLLPLCQLA
jgi:hypothetical protein